MGVGVEEKGCIMLSVHCRGAPFLVAVERSLIGTTWDKAMTEIDEAKELLQLTLGS